MPPAALEFQSKATSRSSAFDDPVGDLDDYRGSWDIRRRRPRFRPRAPVGDRSEGGSRTCPELVQRGFWASSDFLPISRENVSGAGKTGPETRRAPRRRRGLAEVIHEAHEWVLAPIGTMGGGGAPTHQRSAPMFTAAENCRSSSVELADRRPLSASTVHPGFAPSRFLSDHPPNPARDRGVPSRLTGRTWFSAAVGARARRGSEVATDRRGCGGPRSAQVAGHARSESRALRTSRLSSDIS
jgi:hypothetical protein